MKRYLKKQSQDSWSGCTKQSLKQKNVIIDKVRHFITIKKSIHQDDKSIINIYSSKRDQKM